MCVIAITTPNAGGRYVDWANLAKWRLNMDRKTVTDSGLKGRELLNLGYLLAAAAAFALFALWGIPYGGVFAVAGFSVLIFLAAFASGSGLGFIFGLPRVYSDDAQGVRPSDSVAAASEPLKRRLKSNANLERVSDWLTTMIVGVALTQVLAVGEALAQFQVFLRGFVGDCPAQTHCDGSALVAAGPIVLIMGAIAGFLFMYLYTRLILTSVFDNVEDKLNQLTPAASDRLRAASLPSGGARGALIGAKGGPRPLSVEAALQLMFAALYEPPPQGYNKALNMAGVLSNSAATARADYWFYQAAAFGQKLSDLRARAKKTDLSDLSVDEASALDNALDCASRAAQIDPAYKARLRGISRTGGTDDDLTMVALDERYADIIK